MTIQQICLIISGLCLITTGCNAPSEKAPEKAAIDKTAGTETVSLSMAAFKNAGILCGPAEAAAFSDEITANGVADVPPQNLASVSAPLPGYVTKLNIVPGSPVNKGEVLCVLQHPDFITLQQDYLESASRLVYLQQELERQQALTAGDAGSLKKLQLSVADEAVMRARVQALTARLRLAGVSAAALNKRGIKSDFEVRSPFNGYVKAVHITLGKFANPSDVLFELVDRDHMHLELKVFEKDVYKLKAGQEIQYSLPGEKAALHKASVYLIGSTIEPETRAVNVHAHLHSDFKMLLPGTYVSARILAGKRTGFALPDGAVVRQGEKTYIFIRTASTAQSVHFKRIAIEAGTTESGQTEVELPAELQKNADIVRSGAWFLESAFAETEADKSE